MLYVTPDTDKIFENTHILSISWCFVFCRDNFSSELEKYENQLGVRWSDQRMEWDFWTALLFAGTLCTTIGEDIEGEEL